MANTGDKVVSTQIIDHVDGQPSIVLSNGNWGVFDPKTNMYKDTGIKASPEDDSSAVKYYILNNVTTPPEAPSQTGGWNTLASLNAALLQAGWVEDPLQTSSTNRFCWIATYGKENIVDTVATEAEGHLVFKPKFTRTNVRLWSNYANSPTIAVVGNEIIITNPDGTVIKQKFASTEAVNDLTNLITSLQSQVDGAIYSYSMEGVPTMNTAPTTDWRLDSSGNPITDPATIADVYRTHVGDTYTDLTTYRSYRFSQTGSSGSDPSHYEWKIIEDDALSAALGEIARLGREKITVFTEQPNSPYKKGDMWLDGEVMLHAIESSEVFNLAHWVQPYATKVELDAIETALQSAAADATLAKNNLASLESNLTNMTGTVADAIKDNIISDTELMDLNAELKQLDIDQETLLTTVNYLLDSTYLPATPKATLQTRSNNSIAVGGSMDIYQAQISTMITDKVITAQERADYLSKFNTYKNDLKLLNEAISGASSAIEGELKRLADEKVDGIEIGGRNLADWGSIIKQGSYENIGGNKYLLNSKKVNDGFKPKTDKLLIGKEAVLSYKIKYISGYIANFGGNSTQSVTKILVDGVVVPTTNYHGGLNKSYIEDGEEHLIQIFFKKNDSPSWHAHIGIELNRGYNDPFDSFIEVWDIKLEKGTKATDWTPAPEDVQADIDEVNTDLTNLGTEIDTAFSNLSITNIEANSLDLSRKSLAKEVADVVTIANTYAVSVTDINAKLAALNTEINKYTGKADSVYPITVTASNRTAIDTAFSNLEASIVALYEAIDKKRVNDIEIGGSNLLPVNTSVWERGSIASADGENRTGTTRMRTIEYINAESNQDYYVSFYSDHKLVFLAYDESGEYIGYLGSSVWITDSGLLKTPPNTARLRFVLAKNDDSSITLSDLAPVKIKFEKGNKPTLGWTPAPEDVQADIDAAVIKATYWSIKASTPVIYKDSNSATASGVHTPVTVNGELRSGTTTTQGGFISIQPNGGTESTATASPRTIAPTNTEGKTSYTVRLYEKADKATLLDTMTIPVVFKGASGINVAMSNEADVLPASPTGEVSDYADTGNVIRVFEGANELAYTKPTTAIVKGVAVDISTKNVTNEVVNGNFENGLDEWSWHGSEYTSENYEVTDEGFYFEPAPTTIAILRSFHSMGDDIYYIKTLVKCSVIGGLAIDIGNGKDRPSNITTDWEILSAMSVKLNQNQFNFRLSEGNAVIKYAIGINLTETFGAGNEPTKEECDKIFGGYFEGTAPLSDVALGGENGTYQVYTSTTGITEGTKSVSGLACSFANASNMTTDSAKITFNISGLSSSGTPFEFSKTQNFSKSKIGADGADGEGGINVMITRQGSFRTYWRQIGDQGQILTVPEKVSEIIGGVEIGGVKYVQCKVLIYKGSVDVTASALADPTTLPKWYLNNVLMGSVTDTLNIPITHADGVDDEVRFEYTDTNAKNWEGV